MSTLVETYLATWNETDPAARRTLLRRHWADAARYTDPLAEVAGREQIDAAISGVQAQFPGFVFRPAGPADAHHRQARFTWSLGPADGEPVVIGFDVVVTDAEGRIETVLGFLDRVPG